MKFAFIDEERAPWPVDVMCDVLAVSRSGFYAWKVRPTSARALEDAHLVVDIKAAHKAGRRNYGSPRVFRALRKQGRRVGKKRLETTQRLSSSSSTSIAVVVKARVPVSLPEGILRIAKQNLVDLTPWHVMRETSR